MWKGFSLCLLLHFCTAVDCQAKIKLIAGEKKKDEDDPREVQIISVKNVSHGFSKKFSSPNLISETALFINYLSVSFLYLIFHAIKTSKIQLWVTSLLRKWREKHFLPPYTLRNKTQPLCKQYRTKGFFFFFFAWFFF